MVEGHSAGRTPTLLRLHLGDHLIQTFDDGDSATVQSAVALLRTIFEDHYVDPEHQTCLFFHGCTLTGSRNRFHDFNVIHRGDRVILSDFTFQQQGPACVSLPITAYAAEVVRFAMQVQSGDRHERPRPDWQQHYLDTQRRYLEQLTELARRLLAGGGADYPRFCELFQQLHGKLKRPLELQVLTILGESGPRKPVRIRVRVMFGPLGVREVLPMRLNLGDVVLATVNEFTNEGVLLTLEGVGSGGVRPGDRLFGLQRFYP